MKHYYQGGGITIYHGNTEELRKALPKHHFAVLVMDPPFTLSLEMLGRFADCLVEKGLRVLIPHMPTHTEFCHPHARSIEEMLKLIEPTTGPILDPYMGSGSTLVAAKQLGRECVGMEIEEKYCNAAVKRLTASAA